MPERIPNQNFGFCLEIVLGFHDKSLPPLRFVSVKKMGELNRDQSGIKSEPRNYDP